MPYHVFFYPIFNLVSWNMSWEGSRMCLWNIFCLACVVLVSGSQWLIWSSDMLWPCVRAAAWDVDSLVFNTLYCWSFVLRHCNGSWYIWVFKALYQVCVCAVMVSESQLATWPGVLHNIAILQVLLFMFQYLWLCCWGSHLVEKLWHQSGERVLEWQFLHDLLPPWHCRLTQLIDWSAVCEVRPCYSTLITILFFRTSLFTLFVMCWDQTLLVSLFPGVNATELVPCVLRSDFQKSAAD